MPETAPEKMETVSYAQQRNSQRREKIVDQHLIKAKMGGAGEALVIDLSETGMGVQLMIPIQPGSKLTVDFELPGNAGHVRADAQVVWSNAARRAGIRFLRMSDPTRDRLKRWLDPLRASAASKSAGEGSAAAPTREFSDLLEHIQQHKLDVNSGLALVLERASQITGATGAAIATGTPNAAICRASLGDAPEVGSPIRSTSGLTSDCFRTRQTLRCDDAQNDRRLDPQVCRQLNLRSAVLVPLFSDDHGQNLAGVLEVFSSKAKAFSDEHMAKLETLAEIASSVAFGITRPSDSKAASNAGSTVELDLTDALQSASAGNGGSNPTASVTLISEEELEKLLNPFISGLELSAVAPQSASASQAPRPEDLGDDPLALEQLKSPASSKPAPPAPPSPPVTARVNPVEIPNKAAESAVLTLRPEPEIKPQALKPEPKVQEATKKPEFSAPPPRPVASSTLNRDSKPAFDPRTVVAARSATLSGNNREITSSVFPKTAPVKAPVPIKPAAPVTGSGKDQDKTKEQDKTKDLATLEFKPFEPVKREEAIVPVAEGMAITPPLATSNKSVAEFSWTPSLASETSGQSPIRWFAGAAVLIVVAGTAWFFAGRAAKPAAQPEARAVLGPPMTPPEIPAPTPQSTTPAPTTAAQSAAPTGASSSPLPTAHSTPNSAPPSAPSSSAQPKSSARVVTSELNQPTPAATQTSSNTTPALKTAPAATAKTPAAVPEAASAMLRDAEPAQTSVTRPIHVPSNKPAVSASEASPAVAPEPVPQSNAIASLTLPSMAAQPSLAKPRQSEGLTGGAIIYRIEPRYPAMAKASKLEGEVVLTASVSASGKVEKVSRVSGNPVLADAAIEAVKQWRYEPFKLNGVPTASDTTVRVKFSRPQ
ncbi:MAG TPA: TonB family protein [Terriglobales bacterium]|nr:TonB family protein [Terriglobales bacterium]